MPNVQQCTTEWNFFFPNSIPYIDFNLVSGKKHSTEHALLSMVEEIRKTLDNCIFIFGIFIDLEKAFDTVNHNILSKLEHYGIRDNAFKWLTSYKIDKKILKILQILQKDPTESTKRYQI